MGAFERTPKRDEVCFGAISPVHDFISVMKNRSTYEGLLPEQVSTATVLERFDDGTTGSEVTAFLLNRENSQNRLELLSSAGEYLGGIRNIYKEDGMLQEGYPVGKYLCLKKLVVPVADGYKGVGSALIKGARQISHDIGCEGQLRVFAFNEFDSPRGCPVPFYAKMGFVSADNPNMSRKELIEKYSAPECADEGFVMYLLTSENLEKLKEFHGKQKAPLK